VMDENAHRVWAVDSLFLPSRLIKPCCEFDRLVLLAGYRSGQTGVVDSPSRSIAHFPRVLANSSASFSACSFAIP